MKQGISPRSRTEKVSGHVNPPQFLLHQPPLPLPATHTFSPHRFSRFCVQALSCARDTFSPLSSDLSQPVIAPRSRLVPLPLPQSRLGALLCTSLYNSSCHTTSSTLSVTVSPLLREPLDFRDQPASHSVFDGLTAEQLVIV